ncbi:MAG: S-methyl-5-thioribose-1-phosphate isomerase [Deltaproteobacteria bacterium]|nr:MAG: S-methyl-5-thioribose-1-phosphate isomerase [Deltaproteobacteria bacterium]
MKVDGKQMRPIWFDETSQTVRVIDQRQLPHRLVIAELTTVDKVITAIQAMYVRGAPLIGATGAYGVYVAALNTLVSSGDEVFFLKECDRIKSARPTAVNLAWAVDKVLTDVSQKEAIADKVAAAKVAAARITEQEAENCRQIGLAGLGLVKSHSEAKNGNTVHILTHCNAGWLACVEYGTATAPIYAAFDKGIDVHVWVDETRPLNQGARLTAWELGKHGIKHTIVTDNAGGHLMQHGMVDMVIVGTDRNTRTGDVANKIGTYLKALAARDNDIPFYVALPSSTFDWQASDGLKDIPIEERDPDEVRYVQGDHAGSLRKVLISPTDSLAANPAFDVTPARLVTGLITERGICRADETDILRLFPEFKNENM